jgi:AhpD family alkylhydroperoxidase
MTMQTTAELRKRFTPDSEQRWRDFNKRVFQPGALDRKSKQLIALAVAHISQCPDCLRAHTQGARQAGASELEMLEAIRVANEMRAGGAVAHSHQAFDAIANTDASGQRS